MGALSLGTRSSSALASSVPVLGNYYQAWSGKCFHKRSNLELFCFIFESRECYSLRWEEVWGLLVFDFGKAVVEKLLD